MALTTAVSSSQTETIRIGQGLDSGVSTTLVHVTASPTWTGSLQPIKRAAGAVTFFTSSYINHLNNSSTNAAITGSGIYSFDATGCDIALGHSMTTSGSLAVVYTIARN